MAIFVPRFVRQLRDVLLTAPADGEVLTYDSADEKWKNEAGGGGGGLTFAQILAALDAIGVTIDPLTGAVTISPSDDTLSSLVTLQAPVGFSANSPDGILWQALTEDGIQTFVMDAYGGWQLVAPTGEGAAVVALQAEAADGAYSLNLASGRVSAALDYFINGTVPDSIVPTTPRSVFYLYKTGAGYFNPTLATVPNWGVLAGGHESLGALSAIADGDVQTNEHTQWYDATIGATKVRFKRRDSAGTLVTGAVASEGYVDAGDAVDAAALAAHIADTTDAHDASAVSFSPTGTIAATDVQAAIAEVASEAGGGGISPTLFDANTVLAANADDTPLALTMGASTILARLAAGNIKAASVAEIITLLQPPGYEFGYTEFTSTVACTATTEATANTIVTAPAITFDGSTAIYVEVFIPIVTASGGAYGVLTLYLDGASIGHVGVTGLNVSAGTDQGGIFARRKLTPASGSRTYSARGWVTGASTFNAKGGAGGSGAVNPGYIRVVKA